MYRENIMEESVLISVREEMAKLISPKRFEHTLGVEREIQSLCALYLPEKVKEMRVAALLHDITKELSPAEHIKLLEKYGATIPESYRRNPKLFHALTGAYLAREKFAKFVDDRMFSAILYHTTGRRDMTTEEKLLYLADYIEDTRTFDDCVRLRKYFYDNIATASTKAEKQGVLDKTLLYSFDMTIKVLVLEDAEIDLNAVDARNFLIEEINRTQNK